MKAISSFLALVVVLSSSTLPASAEQKDTPALRLIEAIDFVQASKEAAKAVMVPFFEQMKAQGFSDKALAEFNDAFERFSDKTFEDPAIKDDMAAVYEEYFNAAEIEELLVFYQTPVGRKTLVTMPDVMRQSMVVGQKFAAKNQEQFQKEFQAIMEKYKDAPQEAAAE